MGGAALRSLVKRTCLQAFEVFGLNAWSRCRHRRHLLTLCYHTVVEAGASAASSATIITEAEFREHLSLLLRWFRPVSAAEVRAWVEGRHGLPERSALITFDDGYRTGLDVVAPILLEAGVPAVFFLTTGYMGGARPLWTQEVVELVRAWPEEALEHPSHGSRVPLPMGREQRMQVAVELKEACKLVSEEDRRRYLSYLQGGLCSRGTAAPWTFLSWEEARVLAQHGFEIGSHSVEHPVLSQLDDQALAAELSASKADIEREIGRECFCVAYPFGLAEHVSPRVIAAAGAAGYALGFTMEANPRRQEDRRLSIGRIDVPGGLDIHSVRSRLGGLMASGGWFR